MDLELVMSIIEENGYVGLFFWLWFGVFVIPLPNELILTTVGFASSSGALHPVPAFIVTYAGLAAALTTSYSLGRLVGRRLLEHLKRRKRFGNTIESSLRLIEKYHAFSLSLSCFIPGARYLVPMLYGLSRLSWRTFAVFTYTGAFVWVLIVFMLGYLFGDQMDLIVKYSNEMWFAATIAAVVIVVFFFIRRRKLKRKQALGG
ncbi:DedA family protein [Bacillus sp. REN3]|uniref:DedA family protein n=1 Tax=Bacillus sp. REN3 TaxID=2802440 RepID=UPI001AEE5965|nr:DedA family protein [Bacillus sp. REN3]